MNKNTSEELTRESTSYRLKAEMRVYYGDLQKVVLSGFSVDISSGGLFLNSESLLNVGDKIRLNFTIPDENKVFNCNASIAWVNIKDDPVKPTLPPGFGVQFIDLPLDSIKAIQRFLKHNIIEPKW
jgi:uncharacterized protein (TIGR02266 family)